LQIRQTTDPPFVERPQSPASGDVLEPTPSTMITAEPLRLGGRVDFRALFLAPDRYDHQRVEVRGIVSLEDEAVYESEDDHAVERSLRLTFGREFSEDEAMRGRLCTVRGIFRAGEPGATDDAGEIETLEIRDCDTKRRAQQRRITEVGVTYCIPAPNTDSELPPASLTICDGSNLGVRTE
jgi:hypothetical protein